MEMLRQRISLQLNTVYMTLLTDLYVHFFSSCVYKSYNTKCVAYVCIQSGLTPLHVASFSGYAMLVEHLLGEGADVNSRGQCGETPLHLAAVGSTTTVVNLLLNAGADVNDAAQVSQSCPM